MMKDEQLEQLIATLTVQKDNNKISDMLSKTGTELS